MHSLPLGLFFLSYGKQGEKKGLELALVLPGTGYVFNPTMGNSIFFLFFPSCILLELFKRARQLFAPEPQLSLR